MKCPNCAVWTYFLCFSAFWKVLRWMCSWVYVSLSKQCIRQVCPSFDFFCGIYSGLTGTTQLQVEDKVFKTFELLRVLLFHSLLSEKTTLAYIYEGQSNSTPNSRHQQVREMSTLEIQNQTYFFLFHHSFIKLKVKISHLVNLQNCREFWAKS